MLEIDDLPTFNILVFPDEADQQLQTDTATVPVDAHEGIDETIDSPNFNILDKALDEFNSIAQKVEACEKGKVARGKKSIKKLSERKYSKLTQRVNMNVTISRKL